MDKKCSKCGHKKDLSAFNKRGNDHSGYCKLCQSKVYKAHYRANKAKIIQKVKAYANENRIKIKAEIDRLKSMPCVDCKSSFPPVCMDFDHRPGTVKLADISTLASKKSISLETVLNEVRKCDLVCSNCHRIRTFSRVGSAATALVL